MYCIINCKLTYKIIIIIIIIIIITITIIITLFDCFERDQGEN